MAGMSGPNVRFLTVCTALTGAVATVAIVASVVPVVAVAAAPTAITMSEAVPIAADAAGDVGLMATPGGNVSQYKAKCDVQTSLAKAIAVEARRKKVDVTLVPDIATATGPVLSIVIEGMLGFSGPWKGPKTLTLRGELRDGETSLGSFVARTKGAGLFQGSCEDFTEAAERAAREIAKWLKAPKPRARLGEA